MVWVNLLPWRQQRIARRQRNHLLTLAALLITGLCLIAVLCYRISADNQQWQQRLQQRQAAIARADGLAKQLAQLQQEHQSLLGQQQQQRRQQQINQQWMRFALALPQLMPEQLWLTSISKAAAGFTLHGVGRRLADISALRQRLEQQSLFRQVLYGPVERQSGGEMHFSLIASLQEDLANE